MKSDEDRPITNPSVVFRDDLDKWAILFDPDTANSFGLNPSGIFIWKRLDGKHTVKEIANELRTDFKNVPLEVENQVARLIDNLVQRGLAGHTVKED
jgi:SynChlorMet cassette protein ScmD